ncbi:MAG: hypothetical protein GY820_46575 [Gammaproteobacteria bacterium]|nr:hypothetical protein [Gammaproteobacteria bacterium]
MKGKRKGKKEGGKGKMGKRGEERAGREGKKGEGQWFVQILASNVKNYCASRRLTTTSLIEELKFNFTY